MPGRPSNPPSGTGARFRHQAARRRPALRPAGAPDPPQGPVGRVAAKPPGTISDPRALDQATTDRSGPPGGTRRSGREHSTPGRPQKSASPAGGDVTRPVPWVRWSGRRWAPAQRTAQQGRPNPDRRVVPTRRGLRSSPVPIRFPLLQAGSIRGSSIGRLAQKHRPPMAGPVHVAQLGAFRWRMQSLPPSSRCMGPPVTSPLHQARHLVLLPRRPRSTAPSLADHRSMVDRVTRWELSVKLG